MFFYVRYKVNRHYSFIMNLMQHICCIFFVLISQSHCYEIEEELLYGHFPEDFIWGSATAAYQVLITSSNHRANELTRGRITGGGGLGRGRQGSEHLGRVHQEGGGHQGRVQRGRGVRLLPQVRGGRGSPGRPRGRQLQVVDM